MAEVTILYWRDIPAQVLSGRGRSAIKRALPERFEQAIDRAAMRAGLSGTDDYLAEWRKAPPTEVPGEAAQAVDSVASAIDRDYDTARLKALIEKDGRA